MKRVNIVVTVILAVASTSLVASPQTKDVKGPAIGKVAKAAHLHQVANYPTMLDLTFPGFWGRDDENRRRALAYRFD